MRNQGTLNVAPNLQNPKSKAMNEERSGAS